MADDDRSIRVRLIAEIGSYRDGLRRAAADTKDFGREISGMGKTSKADLEKVGHGALLMAGGLAVGFGLAAKAAIDWESAWAGVTKTVDGTTEQMADLEDGLRDLAGELPATHAEIAAVAEAAGALGIQRDAIESFTKTMIDLGETTDLTADQAATAMAQIANVMQTPQTEFDRMGATLVELGNNGASTESEILELANRLAAAGQIAGLSEADVFSFASTLASVGVEAEAGGTALSKVFTKVRDAVIDGGDELETFAKVAGVSAEHFAAAFREDPAHAIDLFIDGLGRINEAGQSTTAVFDDLQLTDERLKRALLSTAGAGELLTDQIEMGRKAWEENNALQTEAEKRYSTTAAKMEMARNNITDLAIDIGGVLLPALAAGADGASTMAHGFQEMPGPMAAITAGLGGVALAGLGAAAGAALLIPKIAALRTTLLGMGAAGRVAAASLPWLAAAAAAIATVSYVYGQNAKAAEEAEENTKGFTDAIREAGNATDGTRDHISGLIKDSPELAELMDETGTSVEEMRSALMGSDADFEAFKQGLIEQADAAGVSNDAMAVAVLGLDGLRDAARGGADEAATLGRVLEGTDTSGAAAGLDAITVSAEEQAEATKDARKEFEDLIDAYQAAVDPLFGMLDALDANKEAQGAEAAARAEGAKNIADAQGVVADAEKDLRDARGKKDNAEGIAAAEERLADARERLAEVTADAAITAEEKAQFDRDAAQSALDVEIASRELAAAVRDGTVDVETAKGMLAEWVAQGLITEEQAKDVATQFAAAAYTASLYAGDYVASVYLVGAEKVDEQLKGLQDRIDGLNATGQSMGVDMLQAESQLMRRAGAIHGGATGGIVGQLGTAGYTDTVPTWLTPGEGIVNLQGMSMLGPAGLDALNSGRLLEPPSGPSYAYASQSTDQSFHAPITVIGDASRSQVTEIPFRLKMMQLQFQNR